MPASRRVRRIVRGNGARRRGQRRRRGRGYVPARAARRERRALEPPAPPARRREPAAARAPAPRARGGAAGTGTAGTGGAAGTGTAGSGGSSCTTPPAPSELVGWAASGTATTGGGSATPQTVTTVAALKTAVAGTDAAVIYVSGVLPTDTVTIGSNKTIVGLCGAEIHGHIDLTGSSNVIIRNIKVVGYGVGNCTLDPSFDAAVGCSSGNDAITVARRITSGSITMTSPTARTATWTSRSAPTS